jgi:hypothetical protein
MKVSKTVLAVAVALLLLFFVFRGTSGYMVGHPVQTNISDSQFSNFFSRMTKLGPELKCNPGSADAVDPKTGKRHVMSSYYTGGLLPGGYCDDQQVVAEAMNYKLTGEKPDMLGD